MKSCLLENAWLRLMESGLHTAMMCEKVVVKAGKRPTNCGAQTVMKLQLMAKNVLGEIEEKLLLKYVEIIRRKYVVFTWKND